jgi:hypothetical protein
VGFYHELLVGGVFIFGGFFRRVFVVYRTLTSKTLGASLPNPDQGGSSCAKTPLEPPRAFHPKLTVGEDSTGQTLKFLLVLVG